MDTDDDSAVLLAEFRTWLDRERGLSPVSVRCYSKQAKYFLAAVGGPGAVSGLDAGKVTAFMVDHSRDRNTLVGEGDGDVAAGVPAVRARDRADGRPAGRGGPGGRVVAAGRAAARPAGGRDRAAAGRLRPGDGGRPA